MRFSTWIMTKHNLKHVNIEDEFCYPKTISLDTYISRQIPLGYKPKNCGKIKNSQN